MKRLRVPIAIFFTILSLPLISSLLFRFIMIAKLAKKHGKDKWWIKILILDFIWDDVKANYRFTGMFQDTPAKVDEVVTNRLKRYKKKYALEAYKVGDDKKVKVWLPKKNLKPIEKYRLWWAVTMCRILSKFDKGHC